MAERTSGKVKRLVSDRGFGFIEPDNGKDDVFFHHSGLDNCKIEDLSEGDKVTFEIVDSDKKEGKKKAVKVLV